MMNQSRIYTYTQNREDNNLGHRNSYKFRLFHLSSKISWPFMAEYHTNCPFWPTTFQLDLMFQKVPLNGLVDIPYTIKRKDLLHRQVDAYISIKITDAYERIIFQPLYSFGKDKMVSGETTRGNITGLIMQPEIINAFNEQIEATIDLRVIFCHSGNIKPAESANAKENATPNSKNAT